MEFREVNKVALSKSILEMKFMKRTKEKVDKQNYQQEGEEYFNKQGLPNKPGRFITEPSYFFCEQLIDGRLSFQGENPEIERLMELEQRQKKQIDKNKNETDISDNQMAKVWKSSTKIDGLNIKKNEEESIEPKRKRPKFLKPKD